MLGSVTIGCISSDDPDVWEVTKDDYGNKYYSNPVIRQRLKLGKNVKSILKNQYKVEPFTNEFASSAASYEICRGTMISNNNKNMTLSLMNFWNEDKEVMKNHKDDSIVYVTISNEGFKLLDYDIGEGCQILNTFRKRKVDRTPAKEKHKKPRSFDIYQGCAVRVPGKYDDQSYPFMVLVFVDKQSRKNYQVELFVQDNTLKVETEEILNDDQLPDDLNGRFNVIAGMDCLLTNTYITNTDKEELVREIVKDIPNAEVIAFDRYNPKDSEQRKLLDEKILNNRVRAVTLMDINMGKDFVRDYKLLYLFKLTVIDKKMFSVSTIRSN